MPCHATWTGERELHKQRLRTQAARQRRKELDDTAAGRLPVGALYTSATPSLEGHLRRAEAASSRGQKAIAPFPTGLSTTLNEIVAGADVSEASVGELMRRAGEMGLDLSLIHI